MSWPAAALAAGMMMAGPSPATLALYDRINSDFWDSRSLLYRDAWEAGKSADQPAFNWGVGVALSALNALAPSHPPAAVRRGEWLAAIERYWNPLPPVGGFDVLPGPKPVDRYYDDNAWMVLAMFEAWEQTRDRRWLTWGLKSLDYSLSGWATKGGIYWRESDKASVNTCSNAPVAAACLAAFRLTRDERYKAWAFKILDWLLPALQDPADGLLWDNMNMKGEVEKTKWSYNTALTVHAQIQAEALGWKQPSGRPDGRELFRRAWSRWFAPSGKMKDEGRFAHLLVDVGLDHDLISRQDLALLRKALNSLAVDGRYGSRWDAPPTGTRFELIDQASVLRTMARLDRELS